MNISVLLRSLGTMVLLLGIAMGVSVTLAAAVPASTAHETGLNLGGWTLSLSIALILGSTFWLTGNFIAKRRGKPGAMRRREAMALVGAGWFVCSIVTALPYVFCEPHVSFVDALFESVSGLTTTGSSIFVDLESLPKSILMWRAVTQWVGGMGILAMFVVVLSGMTSSSKTLIGAESSLANSDIASLRETMRKIWAIYGIFTLICFLGLWAMGLSPFRAISHTLTTVSTGGFGTENASIGSPIFTHPMKIWMTAFMIFGSISFPFYLVIIKRKFSDFRQRFEEVWWWFAILLIAAAILITQYLRGGLDVHPVDIVFNIVSVSSSTGYVSSDSDQWGSIGIGILLILMMIGGCSGSTSGGLKVSRIVLWFRFVASGLERSFRPKVVSPIKLNGRQVSDDSINQLFLVLSLFGFFGIAGTVLFQLVDPGHTLLGAISTVISCLGNHGPAFAEMGPTENFSSINAPAKLVCVGLMILGRLEYVALIVLFTRGLWKKY